MVIEPLERVLDAHQLEIEIHAHRLQLTLEHDREPFMCRVTDDAAQAQSLDTGRDAFRRIHEARGIGGVGPMLRPDRSLGRRAAAAKTVGDQLLSVDRRIEAPPNHRISRAPDFAG